MQNPISPASEETQPEKPAKKRQPRATGRRDITIHQYVQLAKQGAVLGQKCSFRERGAVITGILTFDGASTPPQWYLQYDLPAEENANKEPETAPVTQ